MLHRIGLISFLVLLILPSISAQKRDFRVMFYNVENLFDLNDNPETNDDDFLPKGKQWWSKTRYWKKLNDLSKAINAVGNNYPPSLVGLCEVENDVVLSDLCNRSPLNYHKYRYVVSKSKDSRGMNVALLYQRDEMKLLKSSEYTPVFEDDPQKQTRNILHVEGKVVNGDTLDIFVCHFQSRVEGVKKTRPHRIESARILRQKADSLFKIRKRPKIIIMGDFNDYPIDISMKDTLKARSLKSGIEPKALYNMFYDKADGKLNGSYRYRGKWKFLDQIVVSGTLLNTKDKTHITRKEAKVFSADFLLEEDKKYGGKKPLRTYVGFKYLGGTSDHLPIYMDLKIVER